MARDIYVISDTHLFHENIIRYCDRPFTSAAHMNEEMLSNWNEVVKPGDIVYHLGDVLMGGEFAREEFKTFWPKFHGRKRLVVGNHDEIKFLSSGGFFDKVLMWRMFKEFGLLLTHVPVHPSTLGEGRFDAAKMINVHGHIHDNKSPDGPYKCVCVEQTNYRPVNIEELRVHG